MRKPTVLLDCDGVLADFLGEFLRSLNQYSGLNLTHDMATSWHIGRSPEIARKLEDLNDGGWALDAAWAAVKQPGFCRRIRPLPGAREAVSLLSESADVYVVTSPFSGNPTWTSERDMWLFEEMGIPPARIVHTGAKHLVRGDVFVDDREDNVAAWEAAWPLAKTFLWKVPSNGHLDRSTDLWEDVHLAVKTWSMFGGTHR